MPKYLFILEDGSLWTSDKLRDGDTDMADDGLLDIVRLEDGKQYDGGDWSPIQDILNLYAGGGAEFI